MHLISSEKAKAEELLKATPGSKREEYMSNELLADPLVFIRRWIGEVRILVETAHFSDIIQYMYVLCACFISLTLGWYFCDISSTPSPYTHTLTQSIIR